MECICVLKTERAASTGSPCPLQGPQAAEAAAFPSLGVFPSGGVAWPLLAIDTPMWAEIANMGGRSTGNTFQGDGSGGK